MNASRCEYCVKILWLSIGACAIICSSCSAPKTHVPVKVTCIAINGNVCLVFKEMNVVIAFKDISSGEGLLLGSVVHFGGIDNSKFTVGDEQLAIASTNEAIVVTHRTVTLVIDDVNVRISGYEQVFPHDLGRPEAFILERGKLSKATGREEFAYTSALKSP